MTEQKCGIIFKDVAHAKDEWSTSHDIEVSRFADGNVFVIIGSWTDSGDKTTKSYLLPADEADRLGRALCCVDDDTFDGLADRAKNIGD